MVRELWWFVDAAWSVLAHRPESSVHSRQRFQRERTLVNDTSTTIYESRRRRPGSDVDGNWETALRRFAYRTVPTDRRSTRTLLDPIYTGTPDTTKQSCLCRVWRGGVNWIIAVNVLRLSNFCRRQSWVVGNPIHVAEADATQTRQFCRVWWGGVN